MPKFSKGEIAIGQNFSEVNDWMNGAEVLVISDLRLIVLTSINNVPVKPYKGLRYKIKRPDGRTTNVREKHLKKLPPKDDLTTWDNCIFKPEGVKV